MNIEHLRRFVAAADALSFSAAADELFTSRQVVSCSVKALEREFGITLFLRSNNVLELTAEGNDLVDEGRKLLAAFDDFEARHKGACSSGARTVRIAMGRSNPFLRGLIFESIDEFFKAKGFDEVDVTDCSIDECRDRLIGGKADIALFRCMGSAFDGMEVFPYCSSEIRVLVADDNPFSCRRSISFNELSQLPFVFPQDYSFVYHAILSECDRRGVSLNIRLETNDPFFRNAVLQHKGCASFGSEEDAVAPSITALALDDCRIEWHDCLAWLKGGIAEAYAGELARNLGNQAAGHRHNVV